MTITTEPVGALLRHWRERRRRSQLDVSIAAELSTRHLSCIETGRANPSRDMIRRLCDELDVPLRERNTIYLAGGYAPVHTERPFADLGAARTAIEAVLTGLEPNPALAVNVRWELLAANRATELFLGGAAGEPAQDGAGRPFNVLRATLHPEGLAAHILNLAQWRAHVLRRVRRQLERTSAAGLAELLAELESYPAPPQSDQAAAPIAPDGPEHDLVVPLRLATEYGELALLYTTTVFGSPKDVTLDEIAIETFFPADPRTAALLQAAAGRPEASG
ncbi:helix-turn-helix transcriptional regulator [Streptomyces sp. NPDC014779]|uniref:helix-turn-helix domain-containing protein n=1 Tax=unclassified Streptomyces TaxID=2593676 RepID=UPI0033A98ADD